MDTLLCTGCFVEKPDDDFHRLLAAPAHRRGRKHQCKDCVNARMKKYDRHGTSSAVLNPKPRPAHMQGRQQSIFTGRPASNPPPIKPVREPGYWSQTYLGGM